MKIAQAFANSHIVERDCWLILSWPDKKDEGNITNIVNVSKQNWFDVVIHYCITWTR